MNGRSDEELTYYAANFARMARKKYELYVISRIIHTLNDPEIEFTTQQLVRYEADLRYYLLDLYFPQFGIAVEVDEGHHEKASQSLRDAQREADVMQATSIEFKRVPITGRTFADVNQQTDEIVAILKSKKRALVRKGQFAPFVFGVKYDRDFWLQKRSLSVADDARLRTHADVARLFGRNYKRYQRATIQLGNGNIVWFPKLYTNNDWKNTLSADGQTITMRRLGEGKYDSSDMGLGSRQYVFPHYVDALGQVYYRFEGVFKLVDSQPGLWKFQREFDRFYFDGNGNFGPGFGAP